MHLALARKYRPQNFLEVIGQDPIIKTLKNAIESQRLHHAYLFCGARGVGKTSMARIMAKSINCVKGPTITPCQVCANCIEITLSKSLDVLEIDGASNTSVDNVRELREQVKYLPTTGKHKVYIIDEVHMLSDSAFNALLKTLEEPPAHVIFIFATTEPHQLPITILSRCQKYDFKKLSTPGLTQHLKKILDSENVKAEPEALNLIAQCAQGSVRDSLSLLDQMIGFNNQTITEQEVRDMLGLGDRLILQEAFKRLILEDLNAALNHLTEIDTRGLDLKLFAEGILGMYRHLILLESTKIMPDNISPAEADFFNALKGKLDLSLLLAQYQILFNGLTELTHTEFQKTSLEITFVKLSQARQAVSLTELIASLKSGVRSPTPNVKPPSIPANSGLRTQDSGQKIPDMGHETRDTGQTKDWYSFVKWVQTKKPNMAAHLNSAIPMMTTEAKIEIGYAPDAMSYGLIVERKVQVEDLLTEFFGKKIELLISQTDSEKKKPLALVK